MAHFLTELAATGIQRTQQGSAGFFTAPSDAYRTRDGWVLVPTVGDDMFRRWAKLLGRDELIDDPRYADDAARARNQDLITAIMEDWCASRAREQAIADLNAARIPCGAVYVPDEVLRDPQLRARRLLTEVDYPASPASVLVASTPVRLSEETAAVRKRASSLGEHTDEVLAELRFAPDEVPSFHEAGVV